ncbi:Mitochondrial intermediate peptidase [Sorochytrium milnesiophthora]
MTFFLQTAQTARGSWRAWHRRHRQACHASTHALRELFDNGGLAQAHIDPTRQPTGLFGNALLSSAAGLQQSSHAIVEAAMQRVHDIVNTTSKPDSVAYRRKFLVKDFDQLSNAICMLTDTAEFLRNAHPDAQYVVAANRVYGELSSLLNELNTNVQLFQCLDQSLQDKETTKAYQQSELRNARVFHHDFVKSGIHLPNAQRAQHVRLSDDIVALSRQFVEQATPPPAELRLRYNELGGLPVSYLERRSNPRRRPSSPAWLNDPYIPVKVDSESGNMLMSMSSEERVRQAAYNCLHSATPTQLNTLEQLLARRHQLAKLTGRDSFSALFLEDKMCNTPERVFSFLLNTARNSMPQYSAATQQLQQLKNSLTGKQEPVQQWDKQYLLRQMSQQVQAQRQPDALPTLGTALAVFADLMHVLYDVSLTVEPMAPGETWHPSVRKVVVSHPTLGALGVIYCDLVARDGSDEPKLCHAAHFTVRGRRRVDWDRDRCGDASLSTQDKAHAAVEHAWQGELTPLSNHGAWQIPVVVLVTNFEATSSKLSSAPQLSWNDVETLWHELGHAMHSVLSLVDFQNISGTRCALDFSEIPSVFMEHFLAHPLVHARFAHYDPALAASLLRHTSSNTSHHAVARALETQTQIYYSLADQLYHSAWIADPAYGLVSGHPHATPGAFVTHVDHRLRTNPEHVAVPAFQSALHRVADTSRALSLVRSGFPHIRDVYWQVYFQHLATYSAGYYTYLWSRVISRHIFDALFDGSDGGSTAPVDWNPQTSRALAQWRENGQRVWQHVLKPGNGREPWECVEGVLGPAACLQLRSQLSLQ